MNNVVKNLPCQIFAKLIAFSFATYPEITNTTAENMRTKLPFWEVQDGEIYKSDIEL